MMETLRRGATSKFAALILFIPLIFAFALWGIGPEWRSGGSSWLAKVGDAQIKPEDFQRAYQNEIEQISQQAGRRITPEQAKYFGLDQRVISRLAGAAALDQEVRSLGLTISAQSVIDAVRSDANFGGLDGKFDKNRFDAILRQNGLSEQGYLSLRRREDVREQLTDSILTGVAPAQTYIDMLHKYREETRVIEHVTLDPAKVVKLAEPDEAKLKEFYDGNKRQFVSPETRKIGVLLLTRDSVKAKVEVSDAEIKDAYEAAKEKFNVPETRHIHQMAFADKAAAEKALPDLVKAKNFVEAAVKLGAKTSDIDLGVLTKKQMIDGKIADAAFATKKDEAAKVVEGMFSTVVVKVTDIVPGKQKTLEEVSNEVKDELQSSKAVREIATIREQVEDDRSAAKPLVDTAQKLGLEFKEIASVDRAGNGPDGKPAIASPDAAQIVAAAFGATIGLDPDAVDLTDGGYAWANVLGIAPEKEKPFDDVKADVKTAWSEAETRKELGAVAAHFVERLIKGEPIAAIATEAGAKAEKTNPITRSTSPPGLTPSGVQQAFSLPKGAASSALTADGKSRTVFKVVEVAPATEPTKEQSDKIKEELTRTMQLDAYNTFVGALQQRAGVQVNQVMLQQLLGGGQPQ